MLWRVVSLSPQLLRPPVSEFPGYAPATCDTPVSCSSDLLFPVVVTVVFELFLHFELKVTRRRCRGLSLFWSFGVTSLSAIISSFFGDALLLSLLSCCIFRGM